MNLNGFRDIFNILPLSKFLVLLITTIAVVCVLGLFKVLSGKSAEVLLKEVLDHEFRIVRLVIWLVFIIVMVSIIFK